MGNKHFSDNRSMEVIIPDSGNNQRDKEERFPQLNGYFVHTGYRYNNIKMGEIVKAFLNTIGFTVYLLGIIANFNNVISGLLGLVGFVFGVIKILHAREVWLMKRVDRKEHEAKFKKQSNY